MYHNTYEGNVSIPEQEVGAYAVKHESIGPGEPIARSSLRTAILGQDAAPSVVFDHETRWHRLTYEGGTWMTDFPIEQHQHDELLIGNVSGAVLVGGLGLGYAANLLASLKEVDHVRIIEISPEVIQMVKPHLKDPTRKVEVIQGDLMEYLDAQADMVFDFAFFDIWRCDNTTTFHKVVVPLMYHAWENNWVENAIFNWQENVMRGQLFFDLQGRIALHQLCSNPPVPDGYFAEQHLNCDGTPNLHLDWMIPFFKWWYQGRHPQLVEQRIREYVKLYGNGPDWEWMWNYVSTPDPVLPEHAYSSRSVRSGSTTRANETTSAKEADQEEARAAAAENTKRD